MDYKDIEHSDTMTHRVDITKYLKSKYGLKGKYYKVHQYNNFLYMPNQIEDGEIKSFTHIGSAQLYGLTLDVIEDLADTFGVLVITAEQKRHIICKCGERAKFSSSYGNYSLELKCSECGNEFTAYSG